MTQHYYTVTWDQLHRDARALAWRLLDKGPFKGVVAVTRGGLIPAAIVARTKPEVAAKHALKLCPYPQQGRYSGAGDVQDPANWACVAKAG